jgi:hypothetical protein
MKTTSNRQHRSNFIFTIYLIVLLIASIQAQEAKQSKIGFGVSVVDVKDIIRILSGDGDISPSIFLPINVSSKLRIEPEIGFFTVTSEDKTPTQNEKNKDYSDQFHFGIGIFSLKNLVSYHLYYGARLGYIHFSSYNENDMGYTIRDESSSSGFFIAPTMGGEYLFNNHFSLGGEVQVRFTSLSGEEKNDMNIVTDLSSSSISTRALVLIRCYF